MELFQGGFSGVTSNGVLSHFGSMAAAVQRIDSMYALQLPQKFQQGHAAPMAINGKSNPAALEAYALFMQGMSITKYALDIQKPLRLTDCWDDDPIGSGALEIFRGNADLTVMDKRQLKDVFHPFQKTIYDEDVAALLSRNALKEIKNKRSNDPVFKEELQKRKQRAQAIGMSWDSTETREIVWTDLTLKLRDWAIKNKYDAFVYRNDAEDGGADSYVTLGRKSILARPEEFTFNKDLFLEKTMPEFDSFVLQRFQKSGNKLDLVKNGFWVGQEPTQFWTRKSEPV